MTGDLVLSATGHRPDKLGGHNENTALRLRALARREIAEIAPTRVISGMALGWDQAIAHAAIDLCIPFVAAVPFRGQEGKWPYASQREFHDLLTHAAEIVIVSQGRYAPWKMQLRNEWMVDNSGLVLALWDGSTGGTANCVNYARAMRKDIRNAWPRFLNA